MEKQKTVEIYTISEEELFKSDELLAFAESKLKTLQESISRAKSRRDERSLPAEVVRRVATSGFLNTKELGRLLLQTHKKSITSEFTLDFIWETIHRSHWRQLENFCELEPIVEAKGHEWVFRKLLSCEPERASDKGTYDEEWFEETTQLSAHDFLIILSLRNEDDGTDILSMKLPLDEVESLHVNGFANLLLDEQVTKLLKKHENPASFFVQIQCVRLDTNQACSLLSGKFVEIDSTRNENDQASWSTLCYEDTSDDLMLLNLELTKAGRLLLTVWHRNAVDESSAFIENVADGINFNVDLSLDRSLLKISATADTCGHFSDFAAEVGGISFFKILESLTGWR